MPETASTNIQAAEMCAEKDVPEGTVVITDHQTAGRGQRGNTWEAAPGENLTFSIVLRPHFIRADQPFVLNSFISLAVSDALEKYFPAQVKIKWPNDIMINGLKVCGILIENQISGSFIQRSIAGIGVNVNQEKFSIPTATSFSNLAGNFFDKDELLGEILTLIEGRYLQAKRSGINTLQSDYLQRLFWRGEKHFFLVNGVKKEGIIKDVNEAGRLRVIIDEEERTFGLQEITYLI